jgi:GNAT superfamily N-acetyltransferase
VREATRQPLLIRDARSKDRHFVLETAQRLAAFGPPPWRSAAEIVAAEVRALDQFFDHPAAGSALLVAEGDDGGPLGFAYLESARDYFTGEAHGHLSIISVSSAGEGRGVGSALMQAAADWSRAKGFRRLTLNAFEGNARARSVYEHLGYRVETIRYVKMLDEDQGT